MPLRRRSWAWEHVVGLLLALLWLVLAFDGARRQSPVIDEVPHIGAGLTVLRYGDFRMNPEHPVLFKALAAVVPLLVMRPPLVYRHGTNQELVSWMDGVQYSWGHYVLYYEGTDPLRLVLLARIVPILTGLCGGLLAWWWGAQFGGRRAGLIAMALLLFYPEYLGHSRFVTLDVPTLVSGAAIVTMAWRWWRRPGFARAAALVAGTVVLCFVKLPVAMLAVFVWIVMLGLLAGRRLAPSMAAWVSFAPGARKPRLAGWLATLLAVGLLGYGALWAANLFRFDLESAHGILRTPNEFATPKEPGSSLVSRTVWLLHEYKVVPESAIAVLGHVTSFHGRTTYLFGHYSMSGRYPYFFVTIAIKTPLVMLLGLLPMALRAVHPLRRRRGLELERLAILTLPFLMLFALNVQSLANIGHRHILFVYFPWAVLLGAVAARWTRRPRWKAAGLALPLLVVLECLLRQPNQATYINALGGSSPYHAQRIVQDSNIDWGQDLPQGIAALHKFGWDRANLAYFGAAKPSAYGLDDFIFIIPNYSLSVGMPDAATPDPRLPTLVSLNTLDIVRALYPGRFGGEPLAICNSMVLFAPEEM